MDQSLVVTAVFHKKVSRGLSPLGSEGMETGLSDGRVASLSLSQSTIYLAYESTRTHRKD